MIYKLCWVFLGLLWLAMAIIVVLVWNAEFAHGHWEGRSDEAGYTIRHYTGDGKYGGMGAAEHAHEQVHSSNPDLNYVQWWQTEPTDDGIAPAPTTRQPVAQRSQVKSIDDCSARLGDIEFELENGFNLIERPAQWEGIEADILAKCLNMYLACTPLCFAVWVDDDFTDGSEQYLLQGVLLPETFRINTWLNEIVVSYPKVSPVSYRAPGIQRNVALTWGELKKGRMK